MGNGSEQAVSIFDSRISTMQSFLHSRLCTNKPGDRLVIDNHSIALNKDPRLGTMSNLV